MPYELAMGDDLSRKQFYSRAQAVLKGRDEALEKLAAMEAELSSLPAKWSEDSSLKTWFPITSDELESLREEVAELRAYKEAAEKQEPAPAHKPARITEQDAREIVEDYLGFCDGKQLKPQSSVVIGMYLKKESSTLLNELNADREQVPVEPESLNWNAQCKCGHRWYAECPTENCPVCSPVCSPDREQVPAVSVPDGFREIVEAVAHIGVDFGYGNFTLSQEHTEKARELLASAPSHRQQSEPAVAMTEKSYFALADELFELGSDAPVGEAPNLSEIYAILDRYLATTPSHSQQSDYLQIGHLQVKATPLFGFQTTDGPYYEPDYNPRTGVVTIRRTHETTATGVVYGTKEEAWAVAEALKAVYGHALKAITDRCPSHESEQGGGQ